jgi:hypothetical protein
MQQRQRDFGRTTELINKFIVDTTQLLNRFAASCDVKLHHLGRQMRRLEVQTALLEYKLNSVDNDEEGGAGAAAAAAAEAARQKREDEKAQRAAEREAAKAARSGAIGAPPGTRAIGAPPAMPGMPGTGPLALMPPPPMPGAAAGGAMPLPPGFAAPPQPGGIAGIAGGAVIPLPPGLIVGIGAVPGAAAPPPPPPPMPMSAGMTNRKHPRLSGYFAMLQAGVPAAAVKGRMQADGHNPAWLDAPDAPATLPAMSANDKKTFYDSD